MNFQEAKERTKKIYWDSLTLKLSFKDFMKMDIGFLKNWQILGTIIDNLYEALNQYGAFGKMDEAKYYPYTLVDYYLLDSDVNENDIKSYQEKLYNFIESKKDIFDRKFDSYEEFKEVLETELAKENK